MITALCGGVGGSKLVQGLYRILPADTLSVIVNTADDLDLWGLRISPDLDTVSYTLGGIAQRAFGWGIEGDTFTALTALRGYGVDTWFQIGDRDLATDLYRTHMLASGSTLTQATSRIARSLDIHAAILPMTDERVSTQLRTDNGWLEFQEYFVRERHAVPIEEIRYVGIEEARPTAAVLQALGDAEAIVLVNSNPTLSILPILTLPGLRDLVRQSAAPRIAVSPLVGRSAITGPAGDLMRLTGRAPTVHGLAELYHGLIDGIVIDNEDRDLAGGIESLGIRVLATNVMMRTDADRNRLASEALDFARSLR